MAIKEVTDKLEVTERTIYRPDRFEQIPKSILAPH
jgi:hypothetical protein